MKLAGKVVMGLSLVSILASAAALAVHEGPGRRSCRIQGGTPWDVKTTDDQITLCRFAGLGIDADSFYSKVAEGLLPQAVTTFLSQTQAGSPNPQTACESTGGSYVPANDLEGVSAPLCRFSDSSEIEAAALSVGSGPGAGAALARALRG